MSPVELFTLPNEAFVGKRGLYCFRQTRQVETHWGPGGYMYQDCEVNQMAAQ